MGRIKEAKFEGYGALNSKFDKIFELTPEISEKYEDDLLGAIYDAKEGDEDAEIYLLNKSKKMIFYVFWTNFIGKEASKSVIKMRITNGEFDDFLSLVYIAFEKAIKAFKPDTYKDMKIGNFQYYIGRYLKAEAISYNNKEDDDPTKGAVNPDGMTSESESKGAGTGNAWDSFIGGSEDEHDEEFFSDWKDFCRDPRVNAPLSKKISMPRKAVLAKVLANEKTIPQIADELGVTKATLYSALNIGDILKDHGIDQSEMSRYLRTDPDSILNPLKENKMRIKESKINPLLIIDVCNQLETLDGGDDFIQEYKLDRADYTWEYLDNVADALYEYGYESQAEQIWDAIAADRQEC